MKNKRTKVCGIVSFVLFFIAFILLFMWLMTCDTQAKRDAGNGAHLHVQLVKANSISDVFDTSANKLKSISSKSKNPFDYENDYSNPVREELK